MRRHNALTSHNSSTNRQTYFKLKFLFKIASEFSLNKPINYPQNNCPNFVVHVAGFVIAAANSHSFERIIIASACNLILANYFHNGKSVSPSKTDRLTLIATLCMSQLHEHAASSSVCCSLETLHNRLELKGYILPSSG